MEEARGHIDKVEDGYEVFTSLLDRLRGQQSVRGGGGGGGGGEGGRRRRRRRGG